MQSLVVFRWADSGRWFRWRRKREEIQGRCRNQKALLHLYWFYLHDPPSQIWPIVRRVQRQAVQRELSICEWGEVEGVGRVEEAAEDRGGQWEERGGNSNLAMFRNNFLLLSSPRWSTWSKEWRISWEQKLRTRWNELKLRLRTPTRRRSWRQERNRSTCPRQRERRQSWCPSMRSCSPRVVWIHLWEKQPKRKCQKKGRRVWEWLSSSEFLFPPSAGSKYTIFEQNSFFADS